MGFPSSGEAAFGGRTLNALTRKVEIPFPGTHDGTHAPLTAEERRRVEEFIGCTIEQSYSEFTVELKNAVHRMLSDMDTDGSSYARHRRGAHARKWGRRRAA